MPKRFHLVLLAAGALAFGACGGANSKSADATAPATGTAAPADAPAAASAPAVPRRVEIEMFDIGFKPTSIDVKPGETVSFVFTNKGKISHDAFLGIKAEQDEHEKEMRAMKDPNDHAGHEGGITVSAGQTGALRRTFTDAGTMEIGCHQAGHYAAGMKVTINVA